MLVAAAIILGAVALITLANAKRATQAPAQATQAERRGRRVTAA
jgi:hypothetical protein